MYYVVSSYSLTILRRGGLLRQEKYATVFLQNQTNIERKRQSDFHDSFLLIFLRETFIRRQCAEELKIEREDFVVLLERKKKKRKQ